MSRTNAAHSYYMRVGAFKEDEVPVSQLRQKNKYILSLNNEKGIKVEFVGSGTITGDGKFLCYSKAPPFENDNFHIRWKFINLETNDEIFLKKGYTRSTPGHSSKPTYGVLKYDYANDFDISEKDVVRIFYCKQD